MSVKLSELRPIVVALDPAVTSGEDSDFTGILVVARGPHQPETCKLTGPCPGHGYVLADLTCKVPPSEWARKAVDALDKWRANRIVAEVNNGGDMVGETIRAIRSTVPYEAVRATRGKLIRAEPASSMYAQGRVHHVGSFPDLEEQMASWAPDSKESPDRLDALVWGLTALKLINSPPGPVNYTDEEWAVGHGIRGRPVLPVMPGVGFAGDTSSGLDFDQEDNGKTAVSPFA